MEYEEELPDTDLLERSLAHFVAGRDLVALVAARVRTREQNTHQRRLARQQARTNGTAPVPQTPEPRKLTA